MKFFFRRHLLKIQWSVTYHLVLKFRGQWITNGTKKYTIPDTNVNTVNFQPEKPPYHTDRT